jgi:anion-transporting  ArsA/GET3 family ATPase
MGIGMNNVAKVGTTQDSNLHDEMAAATVIVTCGTGGVGKTTIAAAIGLTQAAAGRRCAVITIDPAKRLADAFGLAELTNDPTAVSLIGGSVAGSGSLAACMLDTKATFDAAIRSQASSPEQADNILGNRFYKNISGSLSGTQEYMAAEKVHQLIHSGEFDVVVIDTPPAANAIDFITAPRRLVRFLDHNLFKLVIAPGRGALRFVSSAAQAVLKPLTNVVGGAVVADAVAFFQAFDGMERGFRDRAAATLELLSAPSTMWILVTAADPAPVADALSFTQLVGQAGITIRGVVVNRTEPVIAGLPSTISATDAAATAQRQILGAHLAALAADTAALERLQTALPDAAFQRVERRPTDVHDMGMLQSLLSC